MPIFFITLSCAVLRWNEMIEIFSKLNTLNLIDNDIENMTYKKRCYTLKKNPVLLDRQSQYRVEVFYKVFVLKIPLGKTSSYAIRVAFQISGSPYIHYLDTQWTKTKERVKRRIYQIS